MLLQCTKDAPTVAGRPYQNTIINSEQVEILEPVVANTANGQFAALRFTLDTGATIDWLFESEEDRDDEKNTLVTATNTGGGDGGTTTPTGELPKLLLPVRLVSKADTTLTADDYLVIIDNAGGSKQVSAALPKPDGTMNGQIFVIKLANDPDGVANSSAQVVGNEGALIDGSSSVSLTTAQACVTVQAYNGNYWIINRV